MLRSLAAWLGMLSLATALPTEYNSLQTRGDGYSPPRSIVYAQTFHYTNGSQLSLLPLVQEHTQATHVYLAALHINTNPGDINLNDNNPNDTVWDTVWSEAAQLQRNGVKVMFMMGGAARGSYQHLCSGDGNDDGVIISEDYYIPLRDTIRYHKIDGIDLDIEEYVDNSCPVALLQRLHQDFGPGFILTMAPVASDMDSREYGLGPDSYKDVDSKATAADKPNGKLVNWFNVQFYNGWGDASTPVGYNAIIQNGWAPDRIVLGVLDNSNDGGSGWYDLHTYRSTIATLKANYPTFGGDVGWEYWDAGGSDGLAEPWQWVQNISAATFGAPATKNLAASPIPTGPSPWPLLTQTIQNLNVSHIEAIKALNVTGGDLNKALEWLGLGSLLPLT